MGKEPVKIDKRRKRPEATAFHQKSTYLTPAENEKFNKKRGLVTQAAFLRDILQKAGVI